MMPRIRFDDQLDSLSNFHLNNIQESSKTKNEITVTQYVFNDIKYITWFKNNATEMNITEILMYLFQGIILVVNLIWDPLKIYNIFIIRS